MKTVIEMAREAGCYAEMGLTAGNMTAALERFAALVREDAIDKFNRQINQACEEARLLDKQEISDKQGSFTEKNLSPVVCEHTNQSVTHYSNETWIQHCESCGVVIKSGTYINENGAVTNEVTTQQEPVAWALMHKNGLELNSGYGVRKTLQEAEDMQRRHLGNVKIVPLYTTPPSTAQEPRNFGIEMLKQYERGVKAGGCIAARQMRDAAVKALADEEKRVQGLYEQYKTGSPKHEFGVGMWNGLTLASQTIAALPILGEENV